MLSKPEKFYSFPVPHVEHMPKRPIKPGSDRGNLANMVAALAWPYLVGAHKQLDRYEEVAKLLPTDPEKASIACLYETSSLFEDLDTIDRYAQMCGATHALHPHILNIRNHIRHDIRDNLDQDGLKRRRSRARKLGLSEGKYIAFFAFNESGIMVGDVIVRVKEIREFLDWALEVFLDVIREAEAADVAAGIKKPIKMPPQRRPSP